MILTPRKRIEERIEQCQKSPAGGETLIEVIEGLLKEEVYRAQTNAPSHVRWGPSILNVVDNLPRH